MRKFSQIEKNQEIYLYPVPVIQNKKYLISCAGVAEAEKIVQLIEDRIVKHPDLDFSDFTFEKIHTDGRTQIIKIKT